MKKLSFMIALFLTIGLAAKGQVTLPFTDDFESVTYYGMTSNFPTGWKQEKLNTAGDGWTLRKGMYLPTGGTAHSGATVAAVASGNQSNVNNSWLYSPGITMETGKTYKISFWRAIFGSGTDYYTIQQRVTIGTTQNAADTIESIHYYEHLSEKVNWEKVTLYYTATADGVRHIGFQDFSTAYSGAYSIGWRTLIDDFKVEEYTQTVSCDVPSDLTLSNQDLTAATFTWTAGNSSDYKLILKDKETDNVITTMTHGDSETASVPRQYLQSLKEYKLGLISLCGPTMVSDTVYTEFTAIRDSFDFSASASMGINQVNMTTAHIVNVIVKNNSPIPADSIFYKIVYQDTVNKTPEVVFLDTVLNEVAPNATQLRSLKFDFSAEGCYKFSMIITDSRDMNPKNDTTTIYFTNKIADYGVSHIISPTSGELLTENETITIAVKNYGTDTLTGGFTYAVMVDGVLIGEENNVGYDEVKIGRYDTLHFTLDQTVDFSAFKSYEIVAYTTVSYGHNKTNDTTRATIVNTIPAGHKDILLKEILDPAMALRLSTSEDIRVTLRNNSEDAATNLPIKLMVNGDVVKSETIGSFPGRGADTMYTFTDVDLSEYKEYTLKVFTELSGEMNPANDTATKTFTNLENSTDIPFFEDFESSSIGYNQLPEGWWGNGHWSASDWGVGEFYTLENKDGTYKFNMEPKYAKFTTYAPAPIDFWMMTKGFALIKDQVYNIKFNLYTDRNFPMNNTDSAVMKMIVNMGNAQNAQAMLDTLFVTEKKMYENEVITLQFTPKATGLYHLGFHAVGDNPGNIAVDNLSINVPEVLDAGITAITAPVTGELTDEETVTVTVKNFGNVEISDVPVKLMFDGAVVATDTVPGPIAPNATVNHTFQNKFNLFEVYKNYAFVAFTTLENDVNTTNDTTKANVTNTADMVMNGAVISINSPVTGELTNAETVSITVKNLGNASIGGFQMKLVTEDTIVSEILTGTIAPGATTDYEFAYKPDLSEIKDHTITVFTELYMDADLSNDTVTITVTNTTTLPEVLDAGIIAITAPTSGELTDEEIVTITVKNFGNTNVSNVPVKLMFGGAVVATESVAGPIAPDATVNYSFQHKLDLSEIKEHTIIAFTDLADDADATNDRTEVTVTNTTVLPVYDAGVTAITAPTSGNLTNEETVTITVKNFGNTAISNVPVKLMFGGAVVATESVAGPIAPDATVNYSFQHKLDLSEVKEHTIIAFTDLADDADATNDSTEIKVNTTSSIVITSQDKFTVSPNPVTDILSIETTQTITEINVFDQNGRIVKTQKGNQKTLDLQNLPTGQYVVRIHAGNTIVPVKIIKK